MAIRSRYACHSHYVLYVCTLHLGAGMAVGPTLFPVFERLGIYDEFLTIGKYLSFVKGYKETKTSLKFLNENDYSQITEL